MDKTPKERIVFDEGVYYGDEGSEISIEDITSREDITEAEVLESFTEEEIFENAMDMMDVDRTEELDGLRAFLDGSDNPLSSYDNPLGGNRIIVRGSIERWDGTSHGITAYKDFDDMMGGADSVFKDCEIGKVWDENGSLFIHGYHHDGGVDVEVRHIVKRMGVPEEAARTAVANARAMYEKDAPRREPEKVVTLKGEVDKARRASAKLAEGRDTGSPAREDPSIV